MKAVLAVALVFWMQSAFSAECVQYDPVGSQWVTVAPITQPQDCFDYGTSSGYVVAWALDATGYDDLAGPGDVVGLPVSVKGVRMMEAFGTGLVIGFVPIFAMMGVSMGIKTLMGKR